MDVKKLLAERAGLVEPVLKKYARCNVAELDEMLFHPIEAGGKRIRPALVLLSCQACGKDFKKILPAAASVELLHTFTLVHDDIMDHDTERRGRPTVHAKWGVELGILVGDALYSSAFKALIDMRGNGFGDESVLQALNVLVEANHLLQEGQMLDMLFEKREKVSVEDYLDMIEKKTGVLIRASVEIGAILAGADKKIVESLKVYGKDIGLAFQMQDDLLDLTADSESFGRPVGSDVRAGKNTLMIVHALENAGAGDLKVLKGILGDQNASKKDIEDFKRILEDVGSIDYCRRKLSGYIREAKDSLKVLEDNEGRKGLEAIADYVGDRVF
ncbi:MAG TPA: polyprenyl synthetase family protein [Candidatus Altiarchaeales archaeon]|nr:polyprenyl synthetase family protein [Candidatus Altiarchaeales archaeon]